jgi:4,5-DOPA dioxygenase extradiol
VTTTGPAIFFAHGNPMNALADNAYTAAWAAIGRAMPRPEAVLMVSAHWYIPRCAVTANRRPPTIHDFGGFPEELYRVNYPAPGSVELAKRVQALLAPVPVALDEGWGLDHGTWSVLKHVFPDADVPVVQLAIDRTRPPAFHYQLGLRLGVLREEGVLVAGSGNIVHNLAAYAWGRPGVQSYDWAARFEAQVRRAVSDGDDAALVDYPAFGPEAALAAPTPEHFLPLLYVLGARRDDDRVSFPVEGTEGGSISMLAVRLGG